MTHEELTDRLLTPLWRGMSADYKRKYARTIWIQFEDNLRSAAYTGQLSTFLAKITTRLAIEIHREDAEAVTHVVTCPDEKAILKMLRDETALLVLLVRVANEERKAKFAKPKKEKADGNVDPRGPRDGALFRES